MNRAFYERPANELAPDLLGRLLVRELDGGELLTGRIVETEAYLGAADPACHSNRGWSEKRGVIWGPPGHAYVYTCYGFYPLFNIVAETDGKPGCVLIRALEPAAGLDLMRRNRAKAKDDRDLCSGPGKLCQALSITTDLNGWDLTRGGLFVSRGEIERPEIETSGRIGISTATDLPLRFYVKGNRCVSPAKPDAA
jgi:DNA-3-methyladenine glycosylase